MESSSLFQPVIKHAADKLKQLADKLLDEHGMMGLWPDDKKEQRAEYYHLMTLSKNLLIVQSDIERAIKLLEDSARPYDNACMNIRKAAGYTKHRFFDELDTTQ